MVFTFEGQLALFVFDFQDAIELEVQVGDFFTHEGIELVKRLTGIARVVVGLCRAGVGERCIAPRRYPKGREHQADFENIFHGLLLFLKSGKNSLFPALESSVCLSSQVLFDAQQAFWRCCPKAKAKAKASK